jgi:hypothetical protein
MNDAAEDCGAAQLYRIRLVDQVWRELQGPRRVLLARAMWAVLVVVNDVFGQYMLEMSPPEGEKPISARFTLSRGSGSTGEPSIRPASRTGHG